MLELSNKHVIDSLLAEQNFHFKKSLGQNFLTNPTVCPRMAKAAADKDTGVIEIGPGIGVLTAELAKRAKQVIAIELDERLKPILKKTLSDFDNVEILYGDVLKLNLKKIITERFSECEKISICANLPYYITSPVIMHLLESRLDVDLITVMVQKEAAERLCAKAPDRLAGAISLAVEYYAESSTLFSVGRGSFTPAPKVDSAVIRLKPRDPPDILKEDEKRLFRLIKAAYNYRRKTLINSVSACGIASKQTLSEGLKRLGISENARAEQLSLQDFISLNTLI